MMMVIILMTLIIVCTQGSVFDLIHSRPSILGFKRKMFIAKGTAEGMSWLHQMTPSFLHLDLKTANILLGLFPLSIHFRWKVYSRVADFGLSQLKQERNSGMVGSRLCMTPVRSDDTHS